VQLRFKVNHLLLVFLSFVQCTAFSQESASKLHPSYDFDVSEATPCDANGMFRYNALADLVVTTTLQGGTVAEMRKRDNSAQWTTRDWHRYQDGHEVLSELYSEIGKSPEAHSTLFWNLVQRESRGFMGGNPHGDGSPGAMAYTMRNPNDNAEVNTQLSLDLRTARERVLKVKIGHPACVQLTPDQAALNQGKTPLNIAYFLFQDVAKTRGVDPRLLLKYACQVPDPNMNVAGFYVEQAKAKLHSQGFSDADLAAIDVQCMRVSKGEKKPDSFIGVVPTDKP
jgi:hypothetical protein